MRNNGRQQAPLWYNQMQTRGRFSGNSGGGNFHAEDGAMFKWESSPEARGRTNQGVYLNDPIIGVYGDPGDRDPGARSLYPCRQCVNVVEASDIGYKDNNAGRDSPTYSDGLDGEDIMGAGC